MRIDRKKLQVLERQRMHEMQTEASLKLVLQDFMSMVKEQKIPEIPHQITHSIEGNALYFEVLYKETDLDGTYHAWLIKYTSEETFHHFYEAADTDQLKGFLRLGAVHNARRRLLLRSNFIKSENRSICLDI